MISVFLTSIRPRHWLGLHANIAASTKQEFEIVITGPKDADFARPYNMRFIQTSVKPAQALEAAARACKGEYIVQVVDDVLFSTGALDKMFDALQKPRGIATCTYWIHGANHFICQSEGIFGREGGYANKGTKNPLSPICPMLLAADWKAFGGMDPCFGAQYGELDLFFRMVVGGWDVRLVPAEVVENSHGSDLWRTRGQNDLHDIRKLWRIEGNGEWTTANRGVAKSYDDSTILTVNQGKTSNCL